MKDGREARGEAREAAEATLCKLQKAMARALALYSTRHPQAMPLLFVQALFPSELRKNTNNSK